MGKNRLKEFILLFLGGLSFFFLIQTAEIFLHPEAQGQLPLYLTTFFLALFIGSGVSFSSLTLIFPLQIIFTKKFAVLKKMQPVFFVVLLFAIMGFQEWMIAKIYYKTPDYYELGLLGLALLFVLSYTFKKFYSILCALPFVVTVALMGFLIASSITKTEVADNKSKPNVLLIVADTLRRDHMSLYGYGRQTTPNIDELASQSMVFENTVATSSWTKPSTATITLGKNLLSDRVHLEGRALDDQGMQLAEVFHKSGYDTALFTANPNAGNYYGTAKGYKTIIEPEPTSHFPIYEFILPRFLKYYGNLPKRQMLQNRRIKLGWFEKELGFSSLQDLRLFVEQKLESKTIAGDQLDLYRNETGRALESHDVILSELSSYSTLRKNIVAPVFESLLSAAFKTAFISSQLASGRVILNHWITDDELSEHFIYWVLNKHKIGKPFFVQMQYMGPHDPYEQQSPYLLPHFAGASELNVEKPPAQHVFPSLGAPELKPEELQNLIDNYDDDIRATDANIKTVIDFLREQKILDNTIIAFVSDHGEAFYEHKVYEHMYSLYAEAVNVPLFFYHPRKIAAGRSAAATVTTDVFPTLVNLSGLAEPFSWVQFLDGKNLFDAFGRFDEASLVDRKRLGSAYLGFAPLPMIGLLNTFEQNKEVSLRQGWHRMLIFGDKKIIWEKEGENVMCVKKSETNRLFLSTLSDPTDAQMPSPKDELLFKALSTFDKVPKFTYQACPAKESLQKSGKNTAN